MQFKSPGVFTGYYKDAAKTAEVQDAGRLGADRRCRLVRPEDRDICKIIDRAKDVGKLNDGTLFPPKYIENKLKFYPNIREAVAYRRQARLRRRDAQHRSHRCRQLG